MACGGRHLELPNALRVPMIVLTEFPFARFPVDRLIERGVGTDMTAKMHQRRVHGHAMEPCGEIGLPAKAG